MNPQLSNDVVTFALRQLDMDVAFLYGYGFPRYRDGPMKYADSVAQRYGISREAQDRFSAGVKTMNEATEGIRAGFNKRPADFFALRRGTAEQSH